MTAIIHPDASTDRIGEQARFKAAKRVRGLSDRGIAWLFVAPTIALLLAINIFPLIWSNSAVFHRPLQSQHVLFADALCRPG